MIGPDGTRIEAGSLADRAGFLAQSISSRDKISHTEARHIAYQMLEDPIQASIVESYVLLVTATLDRIETAGAEPLGDTATKLAAMCAERDTKGWSQWARRNAFTMIETIKRGVERTP